MVKEKSKWFLCVRVCVCMGVGVCVCVCKSKIIMTM